jgi:hypothetical protein
VVLTAEDGVRLEARAADGADGYQVAYRWVQAAAPRGGRAPAPALAQHQISPLGWVGSDAIAVLDVEPGGAQTHLSLLHLDGEPALEEVGEIDASGPVTVAVDLMSVEQPTVDRPEPAWLDQDAGWSEAWTSLAIGLGVAVVLSLLAGVRWWWRRRQALSAR